MRARTALLAAAALAVAAPSPASASRSDCWPKGSRTLKQSEHARVYVTGHGHFDKRSFGCLYSTGRRVPLDWVLDDDLLETQSMRPYRLAGRYVAQRVHYVPFEAYEGSSYGIDVIDLRTGKVRRSARDAWNDGEPYDPDGAPDPRIRALILTRAGNATWISSYGDPQVWRLDSRGPKLLDHAKRLTSLRVADGRVHWKNDGLPKVASFR